MRVKFDERGNIIKELSRLQTLSLLQHALLYVKAETLKLRCFWYCVVVLLCAHACALHQPYPVRNL